MQIVFSNDKTVDLILNPTPLTSVYQTAYKHLRHVSIPFRDWDNPFYLSNLTHQALVEKLIVYADKVQVTIDRNKCLAQDQNYFNHVHKIYEKNYDGNPDWLDFHQHIHFCEQNHMFPKFFIIDYREKFGLLQNKLLFKHEWLKSCTTVIRTGDVFIEWSELGKSPYRYWKDGEPNLTGRVCTLAKPWITLWPKIQVAMEDLDLMQNVKNAEFESWWAQHSDSWCEHWNIPSWTIRDMHSVLVIGRVPKVEMLRSLLNSDQKPIKVKL